MQSNIDKQEYAKQELVYRVTTINSPVSFYSIVCSHVTHKPHWP